MPNIHETIKQREIEAGGPGSGRKPGGGLGDFGQGKTSNKRLGIKYERMSDTSHLTPHGHGFKPGNMYPHECAVCGYQKAQHKNGGPVKVKGLSAGGPGSGRKPTGRQIADHLNTQVKRYKGLDNGFGKTMKYPAYKAKAVKDDSNGNSTIVVKYKGSLDKEEQPEEALHEYDLENHSIGNYRRVGSNKFKDAKTGHIVSFKTE